MNTIVVKNGFLDKEHGNERRKPGDKLRRTWLRAKFLVDLGFAVFGKDEEAEEIIETAKEGPEKVTVIKTAPQWVEVQEAKPIKKAPSKKATKKNGRTN